MIVSVLIIAGLAGLTAAWSARDTSVIPPLLVAGLVWIAGVLLINRGINAPNTEGLEVADTVSVGILLVLAGLAMSTALAIGRVLRGKVAPVWSGAVAAILALICLALFRL